MAAEQIGTDMLVGAGTVTGLYIVESYEIGNFEVDKEHIVDENGAMSTIVTFGRYAIHRLVLLCLAAATPETDFIKGTIASHADFNTMYVDDYSRAQVKGVHKVNVTLIDYGIT
jgi:hypothetical protein